MLSFGLGAAAALLVPAVGDALAGPKPRAKATSKAANVSDTKTVSQKQSTWMLCRGPFRLGRGNLGYSITAVGAKTAAGSDGEKLPPSKCAWADRGFHKGRIVGLDDSLVTSGDGMVSACALDPNCIIRFTNATLHPTMSDRVGVEADAGIAIWVLKP